MNELNDFYDIINALRLKCGVSARKFAMDMKVPPTTIASIFSRRPQYIDCEMLKRMAFYFSVPWYSLLNKNSDAEVRIKGNLQPKVDVTMSEKDIQSVYKNIVAPYQCKHRVSQRSIPENESMDDEGYKRALLFLLNQLNGDGLMLAANEILKIAADPQYRLSTNSHTLSNAKEDKECQENEP